MSMLVVATAMSVRGADPGSVHSLHQTMVPCASRVQGCREQRLVFRCIVAHLVDVGQGTTIILSPGLRQSQLLHLLKLHPGHGEVGHELFEGPRLLRLFLVVEGDLLTELPRVGASSTRPRHGSGAWGRLGLRLRKDKPQGPEGSQFPVRPRAHQRRVLPRSTATAELKLKLSTLYLLKLDTFMSNSVC